MAIHQLIATVNRWAVKGRHFLWSWLGPRFRGVMITLVAVGYFVAAGLLHAQVSPPVLPLQRPLGALKTVPVPGPGKNELAEFVRDEAAAIQLGKALFWEMRVGSDSKTACATCHFHAGADNRITNQINPGLLSEDKMFRPGVNPNYTLSAADFPFTRHALVDDSTTIISDNNDVVSSQGVFTASFDDINKKGKADSCTSIADSVFHVSSGFDINGINTRRVEPRNTPSVINAVFNFRNFWDGRANNTFNGGDPFGMRNDDPMAWKLDHGVLRNVTVTLSSSSLASQAVGPPMSGNEMSCQGRAFANLAQKLLKENILADQEISPKDSVLGAYAKKAPSYADLIKTAFQPEYWAAAATVNLTRAKIKKRKSMDLKDKDDKDQKLRADLVLSHMEANFSLFFGIALQMYESRLIADDTPFDRFAAGDKTALNSQQLLGLAIFQDKGRCVNCHSGPELTGAAFSNVNNQRVERMIMADGAAAIYDTGFYNIGVRPTLDDPGVGGMDPFGLPLSETRMVAAGKTSLLGNNFGAAGMPSGQRIVADGAFKTPGLRNVEFTGPYFHNGGKATLMQVVDFYNRGGDYGNANRDNFDFSIAPLGLTETEKEALVAFLLALSDDRVRMSKAPFDHPSICVPNGHPVKPKGMLEDGKSGNAQDLLRCIAAVGAAGESTGLPTFLNLNPFAH